MVLLCMHVQSALIQSFQANAHIQKPVSLQLRACPMAPRPGPGPEPPVAPLDTPLVK
jgi:hypothetical protein